MLEIAFMSGHVSPSLTAQLNAAGLLMVQSMQKLYGMHCTSMHVTVL